ASLRNADIDVFLGNWMPSQREMIAPYLADGSIVPVRANLTGARYTLAVPAYLHDAGLRDFADIAKFRRELGARIHGIEPGNEANETVLGLIRRGDLGLTGFSLVESSEQGMLGEVERAVRARRPIVFLGWAPHPMNTRFSMRYLSGGDAWFGKDFGGATVHTVTRRGYADACPNVGRLLSQIAFTVDDENGLMEAILSGRQSPDDAAQAWLTANGERVATWSAGVRSLPSPVARVESPFERLQHADDTFEAFVRRHKLPLGDAATRGVDAVRHHARGAFDVFSAVITGLVSFVHRLLTAIPAPLLIALATAAAWWRRRALRLPIFVASALLLVMNLGYWAATMETLALVLVAAAVATCTGVPVGVLAARRPSVALLLRPILDLMQTLPTFVYLTPALVLFGLGVVPGLVSTVIFALPAPIRLTQLGITSVPRSLVEAGLAFGATPWQLLWKVELPSAAPSIVAGITQCLMLSLSMVVIAALVGAGGLGVPVVRALNTVQVGTGIEAGIAIVLLAIVLDRLARPSDRPRR
ncbi:MAG TPA: choline ABC transporter permease subunit, partial [Luteitalea sp.]|nr:choline ABC transporter permease subunit [Luteitalea sp.]